MASNKYPYIGVRVTPEEREKIEKAADKERRSMSNFMVVAAMDRISQREEEHQPAKEAA